MPPRSPDVLLVVGGDWSAFNAQLQQLQRSANLSINVGGGATTTQSIQGITAGLSAASRGAAEATAQTGKLLNQMRAVETMATRFGTLRFVPEGAGRATELLASAQQKLIGNTALTGREMAALRLEVQRTVLQSQAGARSALDYSAALQGVQQAGFTVVRAQREMTAAAQQRETAERRFGLMQISASADEQKRIRLTQDEIQRAGRMYVQARQNMDRVLTTSAAARINQLREIERFEARLATRGAPSGFEAELGHIGDVGARLRAGGPAMNAADLARMRQEMEAVNRAGVSSMGMFDGLGMSISRVIKWGILWTSVYGAMRLAMQGVGEIIEVDRQLSLVAATLDRNAERGPALRQSYGLIAEAMTTVGLDAATAGGLVFELGKALDNNASLMRAALAPAIALTTLKEVNQADAIKTLIGLYQTYGATLGDNLSDQEKFNAIAGQIIKASNISVASAKDFLEALRFVGPIAAQTSVPLETLLALLVGMMNQMARAGQSGTGLSRLLIAMTHDAQKMAEVFDVRVDIDKPVDAMALLLQVLEKVNAEVRQNGGRTVETFEKLKKAMPLIQEERAFEFLLNSYRQLVATQAQVKDSGDAVARTIKEVSSAVANLATALSNEALLGLQRFFAALYGVDPGKLEGTSTALRSIKEHVKDISDLAVLAAEAIRAVLSVGGKVGGGAGPDQFAEYIRAKRRAYPGGANASFTDDQPWPAPAWQRSTAELTFGIPTTPTASVPSISAMRGKRLAEVLAEVEREAGRKNQDLSFGERLGMARSDASVSGRKLSEARGKFLGPQGTNLGKASEEEALKELTRLAKEHQDDLAKVRDLDREVRREEAADFEKRLQREEQAKNEALKFREDLHLRTLDMTSTEYQKAVDAVDRQYAIEVDRALTVGRTHEEVDQLITASGRNRELALSGIEVARQVKSLVAAERGVDLYNVLTRGQTGVVEDEYNQQLLALRNLLATGETDYGGYLDAKARLDAEFRVRGQAAALADLEAEGRRRAKTLDIFKTGQAREVLIAAATVNQELQDWEKYLAGRIVIGHAMLAFLEDEANRELLIEAGKIKDRQAVDERRIAGLETVNTAQQRAHENELRRIREESRQQGDAIGFFVSSWQLALEQSTEFWASLDRLAQDTARHMTSSMSDLFFNIFTGKLDDAKAVFSSFLNSMLRSLADFMSAQVVRAFLSMLGGGGVGSASGATGMGSLGAGGLLAGAGGLLVGAGAAGTAAGLATGSPWLSSIGGGVAALGGTMALRTALVGSGGGFNTGLLSAEGLVGGAGLAGGVLSIYGAQTGNANLMRAGNAVSSLGLIGTATSTTAPLGGALGLTAAANPYIAAALGLAITGYNLYGASQQLSNQYANQGAAYGTIGGTAAGALAGGIIGTVAYPGIGTVIGAIMGAAIGGSVGGFAGGLFGKEGTPHGFREDQEIGRALRNVGGLFPTVANAKNPNDLYNALLSYQTSYVGGNQNTAVDVGLFGDKGRQAYNYLGLYGHVTGQQPVLNQKEFFEQVATRPQDVYAHIQAGVNTSIEAIAQTNADIASLLIAKVKQFADMNVDINTALTELFKEATVPATPGEALEATGTRFKEILKGVTEFADQQIEFQRKVLMGLTDPVQILERVRTIQALIRDRYDGEIQQMERFSEALRELSSAWQDVRESVTEQIDDLRAGNFAPSDPVGTMNLARIRYEEALQAFRVGQTPQLAARVQGLADPYLQAASQVYSRPSPQFQGIFSGVVGGLEEVRTFATSQVDSVEQAILTAIFTQTEIDRVTALNTQKSAELLDALRVEAANIFAALGFTVPGAQLTPQLLSEIAIQQQAVAAAMAFAAANAPPDQISLLQQIAQNTGILAGRVTGTGAPPAFPSPIPDAVPSHALGTSYVPATGLAYLHRGEMVIPAGEAAQIRQGGGGLSINLGGITINGGGDGRALARDFMSEMEREVRTGRLGMAIVERVGRR